MHSCLHNAQLFKRKTQCLDTIIKPCRFTMDTLKRGPTPICNGLFRSSTKTDSSVERKVPWSSGPLF